MAKKFRHKWSMDYPKLRSYTDKQKARYWKRKYIALKREYDRDQRFMRSLR